MALMDKLMELAGQWPDPWYDAMMDELLLAKSGAWPRGSRLVFEPLDQQSAEAAQQGAERGADDRRLEAYNEILTMLVIRLHQIRLAFRLVAGALIVLLLLGLLI